MLRKHHRAVRLVCQLPLGLRSFVGVLRSWTLASDLPGAVADCCQVSSANPGKSFEQIGGSELGGNFMVLHGRQLAAMRGCKGGRFAATRRYFVSLFVEPWRASGDQRLAVAKKPSRKSASEVIPLTTSPSITRSAMAASVVTGLIRIRVGVPPAMPPRAQEGAAARNGAGQRSDVARKAGEALGIQVNISFDLVSGRWAYKSHQLVVGVGTSG